MEGLTFQFKTTQQGFHFSLSTLQPLRNLTWSSRRVALFTQVGGSPAVAMTSTLGHRRLHLPQSSQVHIKSRLTLCTGRRLDEVFRRLRPAVSILMAVLRPLLTELMREWDEMRCALSPGEWTTIDSCRSYNGPDSVASHTIGPQVVTATPRWLLRPSRRKKSIRNRPAKTSTPQPRLMSLLKGCD